MATFDLDYGPLRVSLTVSWSQRTKGVNSKLSDGSHILMWDFDGVDLSHVYRALWRAQQEYQLAQIHLLGTALDGYYHAYCWQRHSWMDAVNIIGRTAHCDQVFWKIGVVRGFFTLRILPKKHRPTRPLSILASHVPEDCSPADIAEVTTYWTKRT